MFEKKLISIHLNSNRPSSFNNFIKSLITTTNNIDVIEVLVNIDTNDKKMIDKINQINKENPNLIRYIETDLIKTFADAWKPLNILLSKTSLSCKFISCVSDDIRFLTTNWDNIILNYRNAYTDNIFRIRCSNYRNAEYNDVWECGYKPDSYAFYTKEWLQTVNLWNPCIGPDSFQECISYYLKKYGKDFDRDIIDNEIQYSGEEVSENLEFSTRIQRTRIYYKAFFKLMSFSMQDIANDKAYKLATLISENKKLNQIKISRKKVIFTNLYRRLNFFYYRGSPNHIIDTKIKNIIFMIWCYCSFVDKFLIKVLKFMSNKSYIELIIRDKNKIKKINKIINNKR